MHSPGNTNPDQDRGEQVSLPHSPLIVLASASPRRRQLLALMGLSFQVIASEVDEDSHPGEPARELALRLSSAKAEAIAMIHPEALVIAADTLVVLDDELLGKPSNEASAFEMLSRLCGRQHQVYSGLTLIHADQRRRCEQVAVTSVTMRDYTEDEIRRYVVTGDPMDKAGAYAIQYPEFDPVARVEGCYANVMGLPMCHVYRALSLWGTKPPIHPLDCCPQAVENGCIWSVGIIGATVAEWDDLS